MSILGDVGAAAADLLGVIDVGSNSVRLVVFEDGARAPDYVFNEKTVCRLGEGLGATGRLNPEGKTAARAALRRFRALAEAMGVREIIGVGTAALREAEDGPAFVDELRRDLNLNLRVITGREEARLAAEGVLFGWPQAEGVIADLGGSSLELATVGGGEIHHVVSTTAGHLRLAEASPEARRASLSALTAAATALAAPGGDLVLVGGSWRALAKASMSRRGYPLHVLMGYEMEPDDALRLCDWAREADEAKLKKASGAGAARIPSIGAGAEALAHLITALSPRTIIISAYGLREGLVYARMTPSLRAEEPLLAAARAMERRSARSPGFGAELFDWLAPAFAGFSADKQRLARAACLLHDVNWR